ncbi:prepilin peptidase [Corynebacterium guangdongense]|uniref:Leader peptidase (Prepilin peptidase)/N-methyltransferase n=1 Tax=Corynebacterium guangdongense TaxID=1783348 RepID=A0ABU1ZUA7_9CORY|nr:A24 family peptidase [Corynebacterium guangdongense]MDR7328515.1 leader peptidase (prepilin peptidase)/N-methyltransferase [Corynebacterium guangdongense]WJZ17092.1 Type IV leader peptidase family protein [Corynebacterium guangdongense]
MSVLVTVLAAGLAAVAAELLSGQLRTYIPQPAGWVRSRPHVLLAALAGAGAAVLAEGWGELIAFTAAAVGGALLVVIDLAVHRLPDRIVGATLLALLGGLLVAAAGGETGWEQWGRALLAGAALFGGYFLLAWIAPAGLGLGDVKFAAVIGVFLGWFGWQQVAAGTLLAFAFNAVVAVGVLVSRRGGRGTDIPFGPWMVAGAVAAVILLGS